MIASPILCGGFVFAEPPSAAWVNIRAEEPIAPIPRLPAIDPAKVALGERLFNDPRLSLDERVSCASCHDLATNGASSKTQDHGLDGAPLPLNTPTVFNASLSFRLNWEGSFRDFESHAAAQLASPRIMGGAVEEALGKLRADPVVAGEFHRAYGRPPDEKALLDALASFQRSLLTPGARFDRWLSGEDDALSAEELEGWRLFKSLGCVSCHQGVGVGGNLFQKHGIFRRLASPEPEIVRVPSLRNVTATAPYFHDGSARTLGQAVRRMGLAQLDTELSAAEEAAIVAFLGSLTGTWRGRPVEPAP